jgi:hypothetical protein
MPLFLHVAKDHRTGPYYSIDPRTGTSMVRLSKVPLPITSHTFGSWQGCISSHAGTNPIVPEPRCLGVGGWGNVTIASAAPTLSQILFL